MPVTTPSLYIERPGPMARFWGLFQQAWTAAYEDNCFGVAKGVAYSSLLAFFPVLASIAAILVRVKADATSRMLSRLLFEIVPPGSEDLVRYQFVTKGQRPAWLIILAAALATWPASGAMMSLMEGFQAAYRLPTGRAFLKQRGVALLLVLIAALPAIGASALIVFGGRTEKTMLGWFGVQPAPDVASWMILMSSLLRYLVALGAIVLVTGMVYHLGPNRPVKLRSVWPGAFLATFLWLITTSVFAWYVRNVANYNVLYGSIGAVIALLVWMYILALVVQVGCEYNAVRERLDSALLYPG